MTNIGVNVDKILSILIVESEPTECEAFVQYIDSIEDVYIMGITNNAETALDYIKEFSPDAVVLDLELVKGSGNGITLLSKVMNEHSITAPYVLVTTNNNSNITHEQARLLGADFIMMKSQTNYSAQYVIDFIRLHKNCILHTPIKRQEDDCLAIKPMPSDECGTLRSAQISVELDKLGVSSKLIGRTYLLEAIALVANGIRSFIPIIAKKHSKSDSSVERAMQNTINNLWRKGNIIYLQTLYTAHINPQRGMPTINEFVYFYANKVALAL